MRHEDTEKWAQMPLTRLNAVRIIIVLLMAIGYASTMSPLSGDKEVLNAPLAEEAVKLTRYFILTVLCIDPGAQLPGLLDDAKYMCLIQGAIWTFRWGALAHIAMAIGWRMNILKSKHVLLALAISATLIYGSVGYFAAKNEWEAAFPAFAALRLSYAFLGGAALYGWQDKLPQSGIAKLALLVGLLSLAAFQYAYMHWTPAIEIVGTFFWTYLAVVIIQTPMRATAWMNHWPNIVLGLYLGNWPVSQTLILMNPELHGWALIGTSMMITTVIAILAHAAISGHINRWAATALRREVAI